MSVPEGQDVGRDFSKASVEKILLPRSEESQRPTRNWYFRSTLAEVVAAESSTTFPLACFLLCSCFQGKTST